MQYVIKEEQKGEPLSQNERAIGKRLEQKLHGLSFVDEKTDFNGAIIEKTKTHFVWTKGEREVKVEIGTGVPSVRKSFNSVRKANSRENFLLQTEKYLTKSLEKKRKKVA